MRKRILAPLAGVVVTTAVALLVAGPGAANPPGVTPGAKKLANFNIIATPNDWVADDNVCPNNGSRIFYKRGTSNWTLTWNFDPTVHGFDIVDCDGTSDGTGVVEEDAGVAASVYLRVLGPVTASLRVFCLDVTDVNGVNECLIDNVNLGHNKSFTKVMTHAMDDVFSQVLWTLQPSTNFRIAQVDVYTS
jgi:hypothetical protein